MADQEDIVENTTEKGGLRAYLTGLQKKLDDVHSALIGNSITQDGGLVFRVVKLEVEMKLAFEQIAEEKMKVKEQALFTKIIWAIGGVVLTAIIAGIIAHFNK